MNAPFPDDKLLNAAALLLHHAGGELSRVQLNKALFYFDLVWMASHGETYTNSTYVAMERGPVVEDYRYRLVEALVTHGVASKGEVEEFPGRREKLLTLVAPAPLAGSPEVERVAITVARWARGMRSVDLSELSHENLGWRAARRAGSGTPIDMLLAFQQIAPRDPWMDEPLTDAEQASISRAVPGGGTPH